MKIECKTNDKKSIIMFTVFDDEGNFISRLHCQQTHLCEQLPTLIQALLENSIYNNKTPWPINKIDIHIDGNKNITTKRILVSFFNGLCINNHKKLCINICNS